MANERRTGRIDILALGLFAAMGLVVSLAVFSFERRQAIGTLPITNILGLAGRLAGWRTLPNPRQRCVCVPGGLVCAGLVSSHAQNLVNLGLAAGRLGFAFALRGSRRRLFWPHLAAGPHRRQRRHPGRLVARLDR